MDLWVFLLYFQPVLIWIFKPSCFYFYDSEYFTVYPDLNAGHKKGQEWEWGVSGNTVNL